LRSYDHPCFQPLVWPQTSRGVAPLDVAVLNHDCSVSLNNRPRPSNLGRKPGEWQNQDTIRCWICTQETVEEGRPGSWTLNAALNRRQAVGICASRHRIHSRSSLVPRGGPCCISWPRCMPFSAADNPRLRPCAPTHVHHFARTGRMISTAGASANGTARGFSILSRMIES
jgi:hypothetical protein